MLFNNKVKFAWDIYILSYNSMNILHFIVLFVIFE